MNHRQRYPALIAAGIGFASAVVAQPGPMRPPAVPQAIEAHLQQQRTLQQREAMKEPAATAAPVAGARTEPAAKEAKKAAPRKPRSPAQVP